MVTLPSFECTAVCASDLLQDGESENKDRDVEGVDAPKLNTAEGDLK